MVDFFHLLYKTLGSINQADDKNKVFQEYIRGINLLIAPHAIVFFNQFRYPNSKLTFQVFSKNEQLKSKLIAKIEGTDYQSLNLKALTSNTSSKKELIRKISTAISTHAFSPKYFEQSIRLLEKDSVVWIFRSSEVLQEIRSIPEMFELLTSAFQVKQQAFSKLFWDFDTFSIEKEDNFLYCQLTPFGKVLKANKSFYNKTGLAFKKHPSQPINLLFSSKDHIILEWLLKSITVNNPVRVINLPTLLREDQEHFFQWVFTGVFDNKNGLVKIKAYGINFSEEIKNIQNQEDLAESAILLSEQLSLHQEELKVSMEELQQANSMLLMRENHLSAIFNNSLIGIVSLDKYGSIFETNEAAEAMLGIKHQLSKSHFSHYFQFSTRNNIINFIQNNTGFSLNGQEGLRFRDSIQNKEEKPIYIDCSISRVENAGKTAFVATMLDISDIKESEEKLAESKELYRLLAESTSDVILLLDKKLNIEYISPSSTQQTGYTPEEIKYKGFEHLVHPDDLEALIVALNPKQNTKRNSVNYRILHQSGSFIFIESLIHFIYAPNGKLLNIHLTNRDVTVSKRFEKQLLEAKESVEAAMKAKDEFMSVMSHEIRTPMNGVIGMTNLLLDNDPRHDQIKLLKTLQVSSNNLMLIINDILDYSKIQAGRLVIEQIDFDIREVLETLFLNFDVQAKDKGLELSIDVHEDVPQHICGDPTRLSQVLGNLLSNATKFTEHGEIKLNVGLTKLESESALLAFEVIDTGIGIPDQKIESIFKAFQQAQTDTTRKYGGTGLGLTIVKRLVEIMEGTIKVKSETGKGSTFTVSIPFGIAAQHIDEIGQPDFMLSKQQKDLNGIRILYVEDVIANQFLMEGYSSNWNIELTLASNGWEALDKVREQEFDIILMDIQMPGIDGYETTKSIRKLDLPFVQTIPIIALTAEISQQAKSKIIAVGMDDYIAKPLNQDELFQKIHFHVYKFNQNIQHKSPHFGLKLSLNDNTDFSTFDQLYGPAQAEKLKFLSIHIEQLKQQRKKLVNAVSQNQAHDFNRHIAELSGIFDIYKLNGFKSSISEINEILAEPLPPSAKDVIISAIDHGIEKLIKQIELKKEMV